VLSRRTPVRPLTCAAALVVTLALAGCGSSASSGDSGSSGSNLGLDSVKITGAVGKAPDVTWGGQLTDGSTQTKTLVTGTGPKVAEGDQVVIQTWIGDGYSQKTVADTHTQNTPQLITVDDKTTPLYLDLKDQTVGSRVIISESADKIFGEGGNPQLQIGNKDVVLVMFDIVSGVASGPDGAKAAAPGWAPSVKTTSGKPSGLGFNGLPKPDGKLRSAQLRKGTGAVVKKGQTLFVRYLGEVYGGKKPFDENFSAAAATSFPIGVGKVIKGWDKTLVGQRIGSRTIMAIPPKLGYGPKGNSQAGIKGTDTLYFVVDILAAA
jgi:peptidylprolyl isomerase